MSAWENGSVTKFNNSGSDSSLAGKFSSAVKQGTDKFASYLKPKPRIIPAKDPISLSSKPAKPAWDVKSWFGGTAKSSGKAQKPFQTTPAAPQNLDGLLAYAHLLDRKGKFEQAVEQYEVACRQYPKEPRAFNDLALCLARRGRHDKATAALDKAIRLQPSRSLYRNNMGKILVQINRHDQALAHLRAVHSEAVARYNLGMFLREKGDLKAAATQFALALHADPSFAAARTWLDVLDKQVGPTGRGPGVATATEHAPSRHVANTIHTGAGSDFSGAFTTSGAYTPQRSPVARANPPASHLSLPRY